jgi:hypothetical protein
MQRRSTNSVSRSVQVIMVIAISTAGMYLHNMHHHKCRYHKDQIDRLASGRARYVVWISEGIRVRGSAFCRDRCSKARRAWTKAADMDMTGDVL